MTSQHVFSGVRIHLDDSATTRDEKARVLRCISHLSGEGELESHPTYYIDPRVTDAPHMHPSGASCRMTEVTVFLSGVGYDGRVRTPRNLDRAHHFAFAGCQKHSMLHHNCANRPRRVRVAA